MVKKRKNIRDFGKKKCICSSVDYLGNTDKKEMQCNELKEETSSRYILFVYW